MPNNGKITGKYTEYDVHDATLKRKDMNVSESYVQEASEINYHSAKIIEISVNVLQGTRIQRQEAASLIGSMSSSTDVVITAPRAFPLEITWAKRMGG